MARMVAQTTTRKKGTEVYRYGVYRCGFAKTKGPAVCTHGTGYHQERLEGTLLAKFREAMTAPMIDGLARMVNAQLEAVFQGPMTPGQQSSRARWSASRDKPAISSGFSRQGAT